jgi:parallel beta helix pectate lyase-like protein
VQIILALSIAAIAFSLAAGSTPAGATTQRAFVATSGSDANAPQNCSRVAPCRSFAVAIGVTDPGGSVVVLDSGGYGPVTITTSVAIIAPPGVHAAITATTGQPGIVVNAPDASVTLRGLYLEGKGIGSDRIQYNVRDNSALSVENVVVDGFAGNGLAMKRGVALEHSELVVQDSTFRNNGGSGIYLTNGDYFILFPRESILIENTRVTHNGYGIASDGGIALIRNSVVADGANQGIWARAADGPTRIVVTGTAVYRWQYGLEVSNGGIIEIGSSSVTRNYMARVVDVAGTLVSRTGNIFSENNIPGAFASTIPTE